MRLALKTLTYGMVHVSVATTLAYVMTGDIRTALGIGLIEPVLQTFVFALHERLWEGAPRRPVAAVPA